LAFGTDGAWDIRRSQAAIFVTAYPEDTITPPGTVDKKGDFRCDDIHHDGTNHYLYRVYKDGVSEYQKDRLKEKLYEGTATRADVTRITRRLGDEIGKVYGWDFPTHQRNEQEPVR
jgi:hypothetical protein